jgi:hypothetical protein
MSDNEIKDKLNELIVDFANEHNLFSLQIEYHGYHDCYPSGDCGFVTEKLDIKGY